MWPSALPQQSGSGSVVSRSSYLEGLVRIRLWDSRSGNVTSAEAFKILRQARGGLAGTNKSSRMLFTHPQSFHSAASSGTAVSFSFEIDNFKGTATVSCKHVSELRKLCTMASLILAQLQSQHGCIHITSPPT